MISIGSVETLFRRSKSFVTRKSDPKSCKCMANGQLVAPMARSKTNLTSDREYTIFSLSRYQLSPHRAWNLLPYDNSRKSSPLYDRTTSNHPKFNHRNADLTSRSKSLSYELHWIIHPSLSSERRNTIRKVSKRYCFYGKTCFDRHETTHPLGRKPIRLKSSKLGFDYGKFCCEYNSIPP